jgi:hypothetical protein
VEADRDQLARSAPFDVRAQPDDSDPGEVTEVLLYAAAFLGLLLVVAVGAAVVFGLHALRHW